MILTINSKIIMPKPNTWADGAIQPPAPPEPPEPTPVLPEYTIRLKFRDGVTPSISRGTLTQVSAEPNIWDFTLSNANWSYIFQRQEITEVIAANIVGVTDLSYAFYYCGSLEKINVFDISTVTTINYMCVSCGSLKTVPLFNTANLIKMYSAFNSCSAVESGMLALYQQASSQANPPQQYMNAFTDCGKDRFGRYSSESARLERAQIPTTWGGDMEV